MRDYASMTPVQLRLAGKAQRCKPMRKRIVKSDKHWQYQQRAVQFGWLAIHTRPCSARDDIGE